MFNVSVIGNLGQEAKYVTSRNGKQLIKFTLGVTSKDKSRTYWFDVLMNDRPSLMQYLGKGMKLYVQGECDVTMSDKYLNLNVFAHDVELIGSLERDPKWQENLMQPAAESGAQEPTAPQEEEPFASQGA